METGMNKTVCGLAMATGLALFAGQAFAQDATASPTGDAAKDSSAACAPAEASNADGGDISASGGAGSDTHNLKVFSCNGVRVGTAISTSKGPNGTMLVVAPDPTFLSGFATFEIPASNATTNEGEIRLAMTDSALRASISSKASAAPAPVQ
jgi:hypothetical protein